MEEKVEKSAVEKDEKVKKEVKDKAKQNSNIDDKTAAVNEENKIVDIEHVLADPQNADLAFRINNLQELGIGMDRIRELVSIKSDFSVGDTEEELIEQLEMVSKALVKSISENPNGIVLNEDGTINDVKSEAQQAKLEKIYDVYSQSYILSKETIQDVFIKAFENFNQIDNQKEYILFSFERPNSYKSSESFENISENLGRKLTKNEAQKLADNYNSTDFTSEASARLSARLFELEEKYEEFIKAGWSESEIEAELSSRLQEIKDEIREKNRIEVANYGEERKSKLLEDVENLNVIEIIKYHRSFKDTRNQSELIDKVFSIGKSQIKLLDDSGRAKIIKGLALATQYKDNEVLQELAKNFMESLGYGEYSIENVIKLINDNPLLENIQSKEDWEQFIKKNAYNKEEANEIAQSIILGKNRDGKSNEQEYESGIYSEFEKNIQRIYLSSNNKIDRKVATMELLALYREQFNNEQGSERFKELLGIFIIENKTVFQFYTKQYGEIFDNGVLNINTIDQVLVEEGVSIDQDNKERLENAVGRIEEAIKENAPKINELEKILEGNIGAEETKRIVALVDDIDNKALGGELIRKLKTLKNDDVNQAIKEGKRALKKGRDAGKVVFSVDEEDKNKFVIEENMLLIESKLRLAKGTSMYTSVLAEKDRIFKSFHKTRDEYSKIVQSDEFEEKLNKFESTLLNESLKLNIQKKDVKDIKTDSEKKNYAKFLLIALDGNDFDLVSLAKKQIQEMYPDFINEYDNEKIKNGLCEKIYGSKLTYDEVNNRVSDIRKNLLSILIRSKEINSIKRKDINDIDIDRLLQERGEEIDISGIDLAKSDMQNLFENSSVDFTVENEELFKEIYNDGIDKSTISNKREAYLQLFISLNLMNECADKNKHGIYNREELLEVNNRKIAQILEKHPEFKDIIDKNGKIDKQQLDRNKDFRTGNAHVEILSKVKDALTDPNMKRSQKIGLGIAAYAIANSEENKDPKTKDLFSKLAVRIFEEITPGDKSIVDEKGNFIEKNILYYYNQVNNKKISNIKSMIDFVNERENIVKSTIMARRYTILEEEDYQEINENFKTEEEKRLKVYKVMKERSEKNAKDKIANDRMALIEHEVRMLFKKDIDAINDPHIAAIFYKLQIDEIRRNNSNSDISRIEERFKKEYPDLASNGVLGTYNYIKDRVKPKDINALKTQGNMTSLESLVGSKKVKDFLEKAKDRLEERKEKAFYILKKDVGNIDKKYIEKNSDVDINAIWYYHNISNLYSMGYVERAQELEDEFEHKFEGINITTKVQEISGKLDGQLEILLNKGRIPKTKEVERVTLGEKNYVFMDTFRVICQKNNNLQIANGKDILKDFWNSDSNENKLEEIASLYNTFFEKEECKGTEIIKRFIEGKPKDFKDFLDDEGNLDSRKILEVGKNSRNYTTLLYSNMQREIIRAQKSGMEDKDNAEQVYEYLSSNKEYSDEEKNVVADAITNMIESKNTTLDLRIAFEQRDKNMFENAREEASKRDKDTWKDISSSILSKSIRAITHLPKVLTGQESIKDYFSKFSRNRKKITRRITKKAKKTMNGRKEKKRQKKLIELQKQKALPEGTKKEKMQSTNMQIDKATNSQQTFNERYACNNSNNQFEKKAVEESLRNSEAKASKGIGEVQQTIDE